MKSEIMKEFLELVTTNPTLPIYCWVNSEVVCDDSYSAWLGEIVNCYSTEIIKHEFPCEYGERIFERDDVEDLEECLFDKEPYSAMPDEEAEKEISKYIDELDWKKVILIYIGTPDNIC